MKLFVLAVERFDHKTLAALVAVPTSMPGTTGRQTVVPVPIPVPVPPKSPSIQERVGLI